MPVMDVSWVDEKLIRHRISAKEGNRGYTFAATRFIY